jgi:hypothetical protein
LVGVQPGGGATCGGGGTGTLAGGFTGAGMAFTGATGALVLGRVVVAAVVGATVVVGAKVVVGVVVTGTLVSLVVKDNAWPAVSFGPPLLPNTSQTPATTTSAAVPLAKPIVARFDSAIPEPPSHVMTGRYQTGRPAHHSTG